MTPKEFTILETAVTIAVKMTRRSRSISIEDIRSEAWVGALQALKSFDSTRGSLLSHATRRCRGQILDYFRQQDHLTRSHRQELKAAGQCAPPTLLSLDAMWEQHGFEWSSGPDSPEDAITLQALLDRVHLTEREQQFLDAFLQDRTARSIAADMGVHETRMNALFNQVVHKMRAAV